MFVLTCIGDAGDCGGRGENVPLFVAGIGASKERTYLRDVLEGAKGPATHSRARKGRGVERANSQRQPTAKGE
jgi:hypothetical protein